MDRFEKEKQRLEEEIKILEHRYSVYGTVRFIVFLVMAAGIIIGVYDSKPYGLWLDLRLLWVLWHWYFFMGG